MSITHASPASLGFSMPAEFEPHAGCLMEWPTRPELWSSRLDEAKSDYASVARAVVNFEPLTMVCPPGFEREVRNMCGSDIEILPAPLDDSWMRDNGPIFVRNSKGEIAVVNFRFNAWGERWQPYDSDDNIPRVIAKHLGMPWFDIDLILEGGSFFVDGEGTLLTTEQCLLHPNRNPNLDRDQIEQQLRDALGVTTIIWIPWGHSQDVGPSATDGHIDGVAQYIAPGHIMLEVPASPESSEYEYGKLNYEASSTAVDAKGRSLRVTKLETGPGVSGLYCNFYLPNGGLVMPVSGARHEPMVLEQIAELFPDREMITVPGDCIAYGGGGPHCITQQIPVGQPASL